MTSLSLRCFVTVTVDQEKCQVWKITQLFLQTQNEPDDFPSIYRKLISAWGLYHYNAFKGAIDKMTNSPHWRHFPGSKQCGCTCCPESFANITANQILGHLWFPVHGWERQKLPLWTSANVLSRATWSIQQMSCHELRVPASCLNEHRSYSLKYPPPRKLVFRELTYLVACLTSQRPELNISRGLEKGKESQCLQLYHKWDLNSFFKFLY